MARTILQALKENQKLLTNLDVGYLMGKYKEKDYHQRREKLRMNVKKIISDKSLVDELKKHNVQMENILK